MKTSSVSRCIIAALALMASVCQVEARSVKTDGQATVRRLRGTVEYLEGGAASWLPAKLKMKLAAGATLKTGVDGEADISINGLTSVIRLTNNTTLRIPEMSHSDDDTTTMLDLVGGTIMGNVKKISANSRFEVATPHGVMGIRGTDFMVTATPVPDGPCKVTFVCLTGMVTCSATVDGKMVTHTLTSGTSWEVGGNIGVFKPTVK